MRDSDLLACSANFAAGLCAAKWIDDDGLCEKRSFPLMMDVY
jgi:hypothetical protein